VRGERESRVARLRARHRWFDHLVRALARYVDRYGDHYAAGLTYFSLLSLVPMAMIALSVAGFVLAGDQQLLGQLQHAVGQAMPGALAGTVNDLVGTIVEQRGRVGVFGLLIALYSGWSWISGLRDALTAMWDQDRPDLPILRTVLVDLLSLLGLGVALVVSFGLTATGTALGGWVLHLVGLDGTAAAVLLRVLAVPLSLVADWLVFLWVLARLPREPVTLRSAVRGAAAAAVGFELLKLAGNVYLRLLSRSATAATFGSLVGLLVFIYLVSRFLLLVTAWTATATENGRRAPVPPPPPAVIRPVVPPRRSRLGVALAAGFAAGALAYRAAARRR
jgi:membrane protein